MIQIKRAYEAPARNDGKRILVDRVWPRGLSKPQLKLEAWIKDAAPSTTLRRWFGHDPERWPEFRKRYLAELRANKEAWQPLLDAARQSSVTLVYSARDEEHNQAVVLRDLLQGALKH